MFLILYTVCNREFPTYYVETCVFLVLFHSRLTFSILETLWNARYSTVLIITINRQRQIILRKPPAVLQEIYNLHSFIHLIKMDTYNCSEINNIANVGHTSKNKLNLLRLHCVKSSLFRVRVLWVNCDNILLFTWCAIVVNVTFMLGDEPTRTL
jgi:hypothetical protein